MKNTPKKKYFSFTKMQALGNDFVVINGVSQQINLSASSIQHFADRHFGIGFDQLLLIESPKNNQADFYYRIFNADGSEVAQCGNGARCVARFVKAQGLTNKSKITFQTHCGIIHCHLLKNNLVKVNMGCPELNPKKIPFIARTEKTTYRLSVHSLQKRFTVSVVSMGNPHCILWIKKLSTLSIQKIGALLSKHPHFPEETNVGFVEVLNRHTIFLRVFERGVGETLACGSAACAAMVASKLRHFVDDKVEILMQGGKLNITWYGKNTPLWVTGPAEFVFNASTKPL